MNIILLTIESEFESAKNLGFETVTELPGYTEDYNNFIIIRWGNSRMNYNKLGIRQDFKNVINKARDIRNNCIKHNSLKKLSEVVKIPEFYKENSLLNEYYVVRPIQHSRGTGFEIKKSPLEINPYEKYAIKFIKTDLEYRVWFCAGKTFCCTRVPLKKLGNIIGEFPCRAEYGYSYCDIDPKLHNLTIKAFKHLNLEFGAADVLCKDGEYYWTELNTACSLDAGKVIKFYKENITDLINSKFPNWNKKKKTYRKKNKIKTNKKIADNR
jgi:hypothetical protein